MSHEYDLSIEQIHNILKTQDSKELGVDFHTFLNDYLFHNLKFNDPNPMEEIGGFDCLCEYLSYEDNRLAHSDRYELKIACVFSEGGHEGGGERVEYVFSFELKNEILFYVALIGYYNSYNGRDFDNSQFTLVEPYIHTQIRYK